VFFRSRNKSVSSLGLVAVALTAFSFNSTCVVLAQTKTAELPPAGAPGASGAPAAPTNTTPVDITADSQDFAGDVVLCHGNVRVKFKDSIITGPDAQLFKDSSGQAQMAIFTGHPHLVQSKNKIEADKLTFQLAINKIIADGHAHSEVSEEANTPEPEANAGSSAGASGNGGGTRPVLSSKDVAPAGVGTMPNIRFPMDTDPQPAAKKTASAPAPVAAAPKPAPKKADGNGWNDEEDAPAAPAVAGTGGTGTAAGSAASSDKDLATKPAGKIIVDSEHQEYDQDTGHFLATGHCHVNHGDMKVTSTALNLVYGADGKPETALFSGSVDAMQNGNNTKSDHMTYSLSTQRLQASGNVRSKVLQQRPATSEPKKGAQPSPSQKKINDDTIVKIKKNDGSIKEMTLAEARKFGYKTEEEKKQQKTFELTVDSDEPIYIISDSQDYTKEDGKMSALGNVRVYYNDNKGLGHKVLLLRNAEGRADRMIFTGRSQVIQPGKRWIGDKITFLVPTSHVVAEGNTRAIILNTTAQMKPKETDEEATADEATANQVDAKLAQPDGGDMNGARDSGAGNANPEIGTTPGGVPQ
jgi:lipopolysaccharide export system protein LptA